MTEKTLEERLRRAATDFPYPPTPDVAGPVRERLEDRSRHWPPARPRLAWVVALALLLAGLLAVPTVRATVFQIIRAGAITIFVGEPTATAVPVTPASEAVSANPPAATLLPLATAVAEAGDLTTLADAQAQTSFSLHLPPAYGPPDEVYWQDSRDGPIVILVWRDPTKPERAPLRARLRLHQTRATAYGLKQAGAAAVAQTEVKGHTAYWVEGGHRIRLEDGESYYVANNVLIWVEENVTYRLESGLSLEEAVEIAKSLAPIQE